MAETTVDRAAARRFLVRRHLLAPPRSLPADPASVKVVVERLGSLQFDPLDVTGRNHDLVLAARIEGYARAWTDDLLYRDRWLYEAYNKGLSLLPTAELPYYRIGWDRYQASNGYGKMDDHAELVEELLDRIRQEGTLSSTDVEPRASIDWYWRPTNQVRAILEALSLSGVLAISRRDGNRRLYDLSERLFPAELLAERRTEDEQRRHKLLSRYRAHGLLGMRGGNQEVWIGTAPTAAERYRFRDELIAEGVLLPVTVEGVKGDRLILAEEEPLLAHADRARPSPASRSSLRSTRSSGTASCCAACGTSTTSGRSTSPRRSAAGATTSSPCSGATGSSGGSSLGSSGRPARCACSTSGGRTASTRSPSPASSTSWRRPCARTRRSSAPPKIVLPRTARHRALVAELRGQLELQSAKAGDSAAGRV